MSSYYKRQNATSLTLAGGGSFSGGRWGFVGAVVAVQLPFSQVLIFQKVLIYFAHGF